jgi:hypothetical protein
MWDVCNTTAKIVVTSDTQTATGHQLTGHRRRVVGKLCPVPWKMQYFIGCPAYLEAISFAARAPK